PLRPSTMPNSTRWPGRSVVVPGGSAEACRKTSPPSSLVRKPNPWPASYHLTLPVGTCDLFAFAVETPGPVTHSGHTGSVGNGPRPSNSGRVFQANRGCPGQPLDNFFKTTKKQANSHCGRSGASFPLLSVSC